ncbi:hypothetical protein BDV95DRAFT_601634 [Massariosphaeria phaeospora]|uniref:Apple domain-containing protein n=1 Tax=Massariosphaeria phaeospora TaxID=100035 RepID=A0A7C8MGV4_9PLEO|nr:hypothetical protein BDV95DRAFT_601634 [Massariosphaeria phaeospora]
MKTSLLLAAVLAASARGGVIDPRQRRPTSRPADPVGVPDVGACGLDAFIGHTSEALLFCSSILRSGTAIRTSTATTSETTTTQTTVFTTLYPPSTRPTSTPRPPTSTPRPPTSTPKPPPSSTPKPPPSSTPAPPSSTPRPPPSSTQPSASPTPTASPSCGIVGYTKSTAAYYFDSSGTKNSFAACSSACKADTKCKSFGYGEANCMLFDVPAADNTQYNPMSPYTFYDQACPSELPVRKRQINISLDLGASGITSACSCLITSAPAGTTRTTTVTSGVRVTTTNTVTRTVSLLPDRR